MKINSKMMPKKSFGPRELVEEGIIQGVCIKIVDYGFQKTNKDARNEFVLQLEGKEVQHQIQLVFEVDQRIEAEGEYKDKRMVVRSQYLNVSVNEMSNLAKMIKAGYGIELEEEFKKSGEVDLDKLIIGKPVTLNIVHGENKKEPENPYVNIGGLIKFNPKKGKAIVQELTDVKISDFVQDRINNQIPFDKLVEANPQINWE